MENAQSTTTATYTHIAQLQPGYVLIKKDEEAGVSLVAGHRIETGAVGFNLYVFCKEKNRHNLNNWFDTLGEALHEFNVLVIYG